MFTHSLKYRYAYISLYIIYWIAHQLGSRTLNSWAAKLGAADEGKIYSIEAEAK